MKRKMVGVGLVAILALATVLVSGCEKKHAENTSDTATRLRGSITVAGSTSVQPFSEVLAEEFMALHPGTRINVQGGGSSQGIEAVKTEIAAIGASSRDLKPEEKDLKEFLIARDGIAVVVNPTNPINDLTAVQVKDIFLGKVTNWKQVGGKDARITLVSRESGSGTRDGFEALVMNKEAISDKALIANSTGAIKTAIAGDQKAIGYISMAGLDETVKALAIDGVKPSIETIAAEQYKIFRPFIYVTKNQPTGLSKAFIDFVLSSEGQRVLEDEGAVRVK